MSIRTIQTGLSDSEERAANEFAIDRLTAEFAQSVDGVANSPEKIQAMYALMAEFNPRFTPVNINTDSPEAYVLSQVVSGIYAPLLHGYTKTILANIKAGILPPVVIAPPRDAIPLAESLRVQAGLNDVDIKVLHPHVNRHTAGIANNQKQGTVQMDPLLSLHISQIAQEINGSWGAVEIETGIYGTTSLVMSGYFKAQGVQFYAPTKFFGLGPNMSYVHALLSNGEWVAEKSQVNGLLDYAMILIDSMEELGMEKHYASVEQLRVGENGLVQPIIVPLSQRETEIARATNEVVRVTATSYADQSNAEVLEMLKKLPWLVEKSKEGFPFTLTAAIPPMDSKEAHFAKVRSCGLFDDPQLIL